MDNAVAAGGCGCRPEAIAVVLENLGFDGGAINDLLPYHVSWRRLLEMRIGRLSVGGGFCGYIDGVEAREFLGPRLLSYVGIHAATGFISDGTADNSRTAAIFIGREVGLA